MIGLGFDSRTTAAAIKNLFHVLGAFAKQRTTRTGNSTHDVRAVGPSKTGQGPCFVGLKHQFTGAHLQIGIDVLSGRFNVRADAFVYSYLLKLVGVKARALAFLHTPIIAQGASNV